MSSNALTNQATKLAVQSQGEDSFDFNSRLHALAVRTAKGSTRERQLVQWNKLFAAMCADYKAHFPAIYGRTDSLPANIVNKIETAITEYVNKSILTTIRADNILSYNRKFYYNARNNAVTERIQLLGENTLLLKEQLLGVDIYITQAKKRLKDLEAKPTPDYKREQSCKEQINRLEVTREYILGELARQQKVTAEAKKEVTT
jgi:hypothetical protein